MNGIILLFYSLSLGRDYSIVLIDCICLILHVGQIGLGSSKSWYSHAWVVALHEV